MKQHWRNSTTSSQGVSSCIFTQFFDKTNAKRYNSNPEGFSSFTFAFSRTYCLLICNIFCPLEMSILIQPFISPCAQPHANNNSSRTFCRIGHNFYATAVAAGKEGGMCLPVLSGRKCVWCGCVFNFHSNRSLSDINKQRQRTGCAVCSTVSKNTQVSVSYSYNQKHGNTKLRQEFI